jgi:hypothetical protein
MSAIICSICKIFSFMSAQCKYCGVLMCHSCYCKCAGSQCPNCGQTNTVEPL